MHTKRRKEGNPSILVNYFDLETNAYEKKAGNRNILIQLHLLGK